MFRTDSNNLARMFRVDPSEERWRRELLLFEATSLPTPPPRPDLNIENLEVIHPVNIDVINIKPEQLEQLKKFLLHNLDNYYYYLPKKDNTFWNHPPLCEAKRESARSLDMFIKKATSVEKILFSLHYTIIKLEMIYIDLDIKVHSLGRYGAVLDKMLSDIFEWCRKYNYSFCEKTLYQRQIKSMTFKINNDYILSRTIKSIPIASLKKMPRAIFLFNVSTLARSDLQLILKLMKIKKIDLQQAISAEKFGFVKQVLILLHLFYQRNERDFYLERNLVTHIANLDELKIEMNVIKLAFCLENESWYVLTLDDSGERFQKQVSQLSVLDENQAFLAGMHVTEIQQKLHDKTYHLPTEEQKAKHMTHLNDKDFHDIKISCFNHLNILNEILALLQKSLDAVNPSELLQIKKLRKFIETRVRKIHLGISLLMYSENEYCKNSERAYLTECIETVVNDKYYTEKLDIDVLYIGGGHGWPKGGFRIDGYDNSSIGMLSGLQDAYIMHLRELLSTYRIEVKLLILGSCFSASFATHFLPLLSDESGMISSVLSQGGNNYFENTVRIKTDKRSMFFKPTEDEEKILPTGICITINRTHKALECSADKTGLPPSSCEDEYDISKKIISDLRLQPESVIAVDLEQCNDASQKTMFNEVVRKVFR